ncbi:MAG: hydrogenase maturation protease [Bacteroidia bacterium]|nr:hydrogenase maturation protease [Bacteroidia bacterium]
MSEEPNNSTIFFGIGKVGRQDDALGWIFLEYIQNENLKGLDIEYRYQLQIEDAELISKYNNVIFIDACKENIDNGFFVKPCKARENHNFSTHALDPETVIYLTQKLYHHKPKAFIIGIQGYRWDLEMGVSKQAYTNYLKAINYFIENQNDIANLDKKTNL